MPISARPTTYRGVKMRSRLEAGFAAWMDKNGIPWLYEPQCFAGSDGQYLPDFKLDVLSEGIVYLEVKPTTEAALDSLRYRMNIIWESDPKAILAAVAPDGVLMMRIPAHPDNIFDGAWVTEHEDGGCFTYPAPLSNEPLVGEWWKPSDQNKHVTS